MALPYSFLVFISLCAATFAFPQPDPVPIVIWHGMGDPEWFTVQPLAKYIRQELPGVYIKSLQIGGSMLMDVWNSYFLDVNKQVEEACQVVTKDPKLKNGFNGIGFSQGGQFIRALVQRCPEARFRSLITLGSQHQGVYGIPLCHEDNPVCDIMRQGLTHVLYNRRVQSHSVQAQYWKDPRNYDQYLKHNTFLADINNEGPVKNKSYARNLARLEKFVMLRFNNDEWVRPLQSQWFGFYKPGQARVVQNLNETTLYKEDWLGLQQLDKRGVLHFLDIDGKHLKIPGDWFVSNIIKKFLK